MKFLKWLLSGEVVFAGFLLSSVFKGFFDNAFIDLTFLFMVLSVLISVRRLLSSKTIFKRSLIPIVLYFMLAVIMISSLIYTTSPIYASDKIFKFMTITIWSFLGIFLLVRSHESLLKFLKGMIFYGIFTTLYVAYDFFTSDNLYNQARVGIEGENVLGLGRLAAITAIIIACMFFYSNQKSLKKLILPLSGFCLSIFVVLLTGSRMPFVSLIVVLCILIPFSISFSKIKGIKLSKKVIPFLSIACFSVVALVPMYIGGYFDTMFNRISRVFEQTGGGTSVVGRTNRFDVAIDMWKDSPFLGNGIGSFSTYYSGVDDRSYPHNIFLEFGAELGILGLSVFVILVGFAIVTILKVPKNQLSTNQLSVILIFAYLLINANTTGDINDNRLLFSFIALSCMLPVYQNKRDVPRTKEIKVRKNTSLIDIKDKVI